MIDAIEVLHGQSPYALLCGDAGRVLSQLPSECVQSVITSPPYWGLRDYGVEGQLGRESTVDEYVTKLVNVFSHVHRVLRDDGTLWLNLGDTLVKKHLQGIPWRVALAMQSSGWYLRCDAVWLAPNKLPRVWADRPAGMHEYVFLLSKNPRYYYDIGDKRYPSVWTIPTQAYRGAHFATFPEKLVEKCLSAGTSENGCCSVCETPYRRITERVRTPTRKVDPDTQYKTPDPARHVTEIKTIDWRIDCDCRGSVIPNLVLDPFAGSGTVGKVCRRLNRRFIGVELNPAYITLAHERITC